MRTKVCKKCGKIFETENGRNYVFFCPECRTEVQREGIFRERTCVSCGVTFIGTPSSKYCQSCAETAQKEVRRRYLENKKQGKVRHIGDTDFCAVCGKPYTVESGTQKYCKDCVADASLKVSRERSREYSSKHREKLNDRAKEMRSESYVCVVCGKQFSKKSPTVTCSPECRKKREKWMAQDRAYKNGTRKVPAGVRMNVERPKSGVVGVIYDARAGKWQARYKHKYIGVFKTVEEATHALDEYKKSLQEK